MRDRPPLPPPRLEGLLAFIRGETAGGVVLVVAAVVAIAWANSPGGADYERLLHLSVALSVGAYRAGSDVHFVIDDGLMAVFFLLVGLEIRREITEGQLASVSRAAAPLVAAIGGMAVPALIYIGFVHADSAARQGWAIPMATDIAFSLAVLRLLGARVPPGLKVFLTALAIIDDLGAILIIAAFYTSALNIVALAAAALVWLALFGLNRVGVRALAPYLLGFLILWACMVRSGVHATLAGVALAFVVPMRGAHSPGRRLEHALNSIVSFVILPLFGLANAGLHVASLTARTLTDPLLPGIVLGLFLGKQVGVFGATWLGSRTGLVRLPEGLTWGLVYGASVLCGIGFTMSLFIGNLSFPPGRRDTEMKVAVFAASLLSAAIGATVLAYATRRKTKAMASRRVNGATSPQRSPRVGDRRNPPSGG